MDNIGQQGKLHNANLDSRKRRRMSDKMVDRNQSDDDSNNNVDDNIDSVLLQADSRSQIHDESNNGVYARSKATETLIREEEDYHDEEEDAAAAVVAAAAVSATYEELLKDHVDEDDVNLEALDANRNNWHKNDIRNSADIV